MGLSPCSNWNVFLSFRFSSEERKDSSIATSPTGNLKVQDWAKILFEHCYSPSSTYLIPFTLDSLII